MPVLQEHPRTQPTITFISITVAHRKFFIQKLFGLWWLHDKILTNIIKTTQLLSWDTALHTLCHCKWTEQFKLKNQRQLKHYESVPSIVINAHNILENQAHCYVLKHLKIHVWYTAYTREFLTFDVLNWCLDMLCALRLTERNTKLNLNNSMINKRLNKCM